MDEIDQFEYETLPLVPLAEEADRPPADYLQRYQLATGLIIRNLTENVRYMDIAKAFNGFLLTTVQDDQSFLKNSPREIVGEKLRALRLQGVQGFARLGLCWPGIAVNHLHHHHHHHQVHHHHKRDGSPIRSCKRIIKMCALILQI